MKAKRFSRAYKFQLFLVAAVKGFINIVEFKEKQKVFTKTTIQAFSSQSKTTHFWIIAQRSLHVKNLFYLTQWKLQCCVVCKKQHAEEIKWFFALSFHEMFQRRDFHVVFVWKFCLDFYLCKALRWLLIFFSDVQHGLLL